MAGIQMYVSKKNFDVQKAERFFKERRVVVQVMDLKKHKLGERELQLFLRTLGTDGMLDREDKRVREHPVCFTDQTDYILSEIQENPWLLRSPILRCGNSVTVGNCPEEWQKWLADK